MIKIIINNKNIPSDSLSLNYVTWFFLQITWLPLFKTPFLQIMWDDSLVPIITFSSLIQRKYNWQKTGSSDQVLIAFLFFLSAIKVLIVRTLGTGVSGGNALIFNIGNIQICNMPIETNPLDALVAFIFFVLLPFLQLRYPENPSPFHLHQKTIWLSILSFLLYCFFTFSSNLNFGIKVNHFQTLKRVFGSLSLLCLLVLLLPDTWECFAFLIYILWFMIWFIIHVLPAIKTHFMEARAQRPYMRRVVPPLLPITSMDFN